MTAQHVTIGDVWIDVSIRETHGTEAEVTDHPVETGSDVSDHVRPLPRTLTIEGIVTNQPIELPQSHMAGVRTDPSPLEIQVAASPLPRLPPNSVPIEGEPSVGPLGIIPGVDQGVAILGALKIDVRSKVVFAAEQNNVNKDAKTSFSASVLRFSDEFDRVAAVDEALDQAVQAGKLLTLVTGLRRYDSVMLTSYQVERSGAKSRNTLQFTCTARVIRVVSSQTAQLPDPVEKRGLPGKSRGKQSTSAATAAESQKTSLAAQALGIGGP